MERWRKWSCEEDERREELRSILRLYRKNHATLMRIPDIKPGKNPAAIAPGGNEEHCCSSMFGDFSELETLDDWDVEDGSGGDDEVWIEEEDVGEGVVVTADPLLVEGFGFEEVSSSVTHFLPLHLYPCGQQAPAHSGSLSSSRVVLTELEGSAVAFWSRVSQGIGRIDVQSAPLGQQITVLASSTAMHVEVIGQQKFEGKSGSPHCP